MRISPGSRVVRFSVTTTTRAASGSAAPARRSAATPAATSTSDTQVGGFSPGWNRSRSYGIPAGTASSAHAPAGVQAVARPAARSTSSARDTDSPSVRARFCRSSSATGACASAPRRRAVTRSSCRTSLSSRSMRARSACAITICWALNCSVTTALISRAVRTPMRRAPATSAMTTATTMAVSARPADVSLDSCMRVRYPKTGASGGDPALRDLL